MLNEEKKSAIEKILECKGGAPYVIHGPSGTGKTRTLIEAVIQLHIMRKDARILLCAPSNNAADHILEKLIMAPTRIGSYLKKWRSLKDFRQENNWKVNGGQENNWYDDGGQANNWNNDGAQENKWDCEDAQAKSWGYEAQANDWNQDQDQDQGGKVNN
ncbi:hypothetical protein BC332_16058 [Capsicum chinense]|nr:hypothetical protein BC332_16058 [Capsicum chinense]